MFKQSYFRKTTLGIVALLLTSTLVGCVTPALAEPVATGAGTTTPATTEAVTSTATDTAMETTSNENTRPAGWTMESHSNEAEPNYDAVFPQDEVNEITITIDPEMWEAMQANMTELHGEPGTGGGRGGGFPGGFEQPAAGQRPEGFEPRGEGEFPEGFEPPANGEMPEGMAERGPGGMGGFNTENPMWVTATIEFEGTTWTNVGVRYKGNSSLMSSWNSGSLKLPFKLDFDQFEDEYPEINNQRFYGFKQLSLANNFSDNSFMREAVSYDLLEEAGLVASETAFYEVYIDYGEGPVSLGLYTMVEVVDDTVVDHYFDDDSGNIYEGDGRGVSLAEGTFEQIESSFQKENNEDEADWSDIEALYNVLHAETRTTDPQAWRADLEAIFDVDSFLEWLAIAAVIGHWDTYGGMTHNFYLYNNPETGQLTWISWDHNLTMGGNFGPDMGGGRNRNMDAADANNEQGANRERGGMGRNTSLGKAEVGDNWPLIRYLLDDSTYYAEYVDYVEATSAELFTPDKMATKVQTLTELLAPFAAEEIGEAEFEEAAQQLIDFANTRVEEVATFLNEQP